jgi:molecular chaperone Hsp33
MSESEQGGGLSIRGDDMVLPFQTIKSGVRGRLVRLGTAVDTILTRHDYPEPVSHALGEALALTAMLGSSLRREGKLTLQTKGDGAIPFLVADYDAPGKLRGYASIGKARSELTEAQGRGDQGRLLGSGHLALTIDLGGGKDRTQAIVALSGEPLVDAALTYFRQSEQLPTFIRLAVARHYGRSKNGRASAWGWRAGGIMIQHLPADAGDPTSRVATYDHDMSRHEADEEDWNRARFLAETVEDHELLDPMLAPERLLYRLFHEEGVRVVPPTSVAAICSCSRDRIKTVLRRFGPTELADMCEADGAVSVTCEFCSRHYRFAPGEIV